MDGDTNQRKSLRILALTSFVLATSYWLATSGQPLIDQHELRQTQTALTAVFMKPGIHGLLEYETPVLGSPWSIPFEFPLYQRLASWLSQLLALPLDRSGRLLSAFIGFLCILPATGLMRIFGFSKDGQYALITLYFGSSIYLYWNRGFMIESTALFFTLASLYLYARIRVSRTGEHEIGSYALLFPALTMGLLVKVTTILPSLILIGADLIGLSVIQPWVNKPERRSARKLTLLFISLLGSFALFLAWMNHADQAKELNPVGKLLTSQALREWNYGYTWQRLSPALWNEVVVKRMFSPLGLAPGILLIGLSLGNGIARQRELGKRHIFILLSIALWLAPLLIFSNLHIVHDYYQCANQVFLLMALAGSYANILSLVNSARIRAIAHFSFLTFLVGSLMHFTSSAIYLESSLWSYSDKAVIGQIVRANTPKDAAMLVSGDDWNSAFSYHAQRRSLTLPDWKVYASPQDALDRAHEWLGGYQLGAIIERVDGRRRLSVDPVCRPRLARRVGDWRLTICS